MSKSVLEAVKRIKNGRSEEKEDRDVTDDDVEIIAEALRDNTTLHKLSLGGNEISVKGVAALVEVLKVNTALQRIDLESNEFMDAGATLLAEMLMINKTLNILYIYESGITDQGAIVLAEALKVNSTLADIGLSHNEIGDAGVLALGDALKVNKSLTEIGISNNRITDTGIIALAEALAGNTTLDYLTDRIYGNKGISEKSVPALRKMILTSHISNMGDEPFSGTSISRQTRNKLEELLAISIEDRPRKLQSEDFGSAASGPPGHNQESVRPLSPTLNEAYVPFTVFHKLDLSRFLDLALFAKETHRATMVFELSTLNKIYKDLLEELKGNLPAKDEFITERRALLEIEKKIQDRVPEWSKLGSQRDDHRESLVKLIKIFRNESSANDASNWVPLKSELARLEQAMLFARNEIQGSTVSVPLVSIMDENGDSISRIANIFSGHEGKTLSSPPPLDFKNNTTTLNLPWMADFKKDALNIQAEIEPVAALMLKLSSNMNSLAQKVSPEIENVLNEYQSLISSCKEVIKQWEQERKEVNLEDLVPDFEKQMELHEQRQKIRVCQDDLKKTNDDIRKEEIKMAEVNYALQKDGAAAADVTSIEQIRLELNQLKAQHDDILETIQDLCFDLDDSSICRFPDLIMSLTPSDSSAFAVVINVSRIWKIKPRLYTLRELLGSGGFAQVFKAEYRGSRQEAAEIHAFKRFPGFQLDERVASTISTEIEVLCALEHPNITRFFGVSNDPNSKDGNGERLGIGIMIEFCENGSLRQFLNRASSPLSMDVLIHILADVADGMNYLHQYTPHAIIHRDLKSDNVLLDKNMNAKICDFGLARIIETTMPKASSKSSGTVQYKAPESYEGIFEPCSDVYSFGCVIFEILSGKRPWDGLNDMQIMKNILKEVSFDISMIRQDACPPVLLTLMKQCLSYNKESRPRFSQITVELEKIVQPVLFNDVDPSSDEFTAIEQRFFPPEQEGSLSKTHFRVVKITKVRNDFTESLYEAERVNIKREVKSAEVNERLMFHGTSKADPFEVVKHRHGLMRDYGESGFYGKGIYFAELPRYSNAHYKFETDNGQFQLLLCSVICGNSKDMKQRVDTETKGFSQKTLPKDKHSIIGGPHCPTRVGSGEDDSRMVVIYKDSQCTPRYIITYEEI